MPTRKKEGFSIIEVIVVIVMIGILAGVSFPFFSLIYTRNNIDAATQGVVRIIQQARINSEAMEADDTWGVKVQSGSVVLFKGSSYAARNTSYDQVLSISSNISFTGSTITEIVFAKLTGLPITPGTFTLTLGTDVRNVIVNSKGMVSY